jgi:cell division protein FtsI (penicillin-binding protein 3)
MATLAIEALARGARERERREERPVIAYDRLMLVMLLFAGAIFLIAARLALLHVTAEGGEARAAVNPLLPPRGDIVDRNGVVLARTIDAWSIGVQPANIIGDRAELAARLNELMPDQGADEFLRLMSMDVPFTYLRRRAETELVEAVNALGEPGITFQRETERLYPQASLAAHVLGWTDVDGQGAAGVERSLQDRLTADTARAQPVALSIDSRVQAAMEEELGAAMTSLQAQGGTGIVLDVDTGEVVAMASAPFFNPNISGQAEGEARRNNAVQGAYELGSTFKPLTVAAALDAGVTTPSERWDTVSALTLGRHRIGDSHPAGRALTVPEVLTKSSNVATARMAERLGPERMDRLFRSLHFHERSPIQLRESAGTLYPRTWDRGAVLTTGFGHSIAVTPLHLASSYAALVNGGLWRPATLLRLGEGQVPAGERVFSAETSYRMRQMLRLIVTNGSGRRAEAPGFRVGGKTGTAEKAGAGGYSRSVNVSTFAAAFPMDRPRFVVLVMLDAPVGNAETGGQTTAAWTAAPVVSRVIARTGPLLGVLPSATQDIDLSDMRHLVEGAEED